MAKGAHLDREIVSRLSQRAVFSRDKSTHDLAWHWIGEEGDPWPEWLRAFKSSCGVYAIKSSGKVVYVGSSKKRLYDTVTRHFQQWKRTPRGRRAAQYNFHRMHDTDHDPGMTYQRGRCQIAVYTVACGDQLEEEAKLIARLKPRDNLVANPDGLEDAPF